MDDDGSNGNRTFDGPQQKVPVHQFPKPTISSSRSSSSTASSEESYDPHLVAHVHPPAPDMDSSAQDARRRRAMLMNHPNECIADTLRDTKNPRRHRRKQGKEMDDLSTHQHPMGPPDDGHSSVFSSISASDDVELDHLSSEEGSPDDEETGLTKRDPNNRKWKRRKHIQLDDRVMGTPDVTEQERASANKSVLKALIMNSLLIASWYTFSLSISIVSLALLFFMNHG